MLKKIFGSRNQRLIKRYNKKVKLVNALEEQTQALTDEELKGKTSEFRQRIADGESLDSLLPEAFAVCREASVRSLGMRHFDVQLIGGMVLHDGNIAEMRTGEGKTLVATLAVYLNALTGDGVHVVTVNDYLAQRDAEWMGKLYNFLGMSVGVVVSGQDQETKRAAYAADITYGTNNEYGFDYLRDNMAFRADDRVQRKLNYAIVDEVDSILIDEARTPLIISGPAEDSTDLYVKINEVIPKLTRQDEETPEDGEDTGDYYVDEKARQVFLTDLGHEHVESLLKEAGLLEEDSNLYDVANISLMHHVHAALRAHTLFRREVDYIVRNGEIMIIDEFTGRMMPGRRWSEGLHQAVEAKEGVVIQKENQTLASITFQNYFRLYNKLAGMTGTADTEAPEFMQIYNLEVVVMPTNKPQARDDAPDQIYRTAEEKYAAIINDIKGRAANQQPVLVGTASIETSELLSNLLQKEGIKHEVLNAKHHEREAMIVSQAGAPGAVTIATNMAGRGTDIVLGGNYEMRLKAEGVEDPDEFAKAKAQWEKDHEQVIAAGGLHVIGTERNESRRVDNQLRGRSGRQGDPGSTRFYLSLEDSLMRIFGSERIAGLMQKLGMEEGEAIEHPWVNKAIENAQKKVEGRNFDMRKQLLEYDDVANDQRKVIYEQRNSLMEVDDISENIKVIRSEVINDLVDQFIPPQSLEEQWDVEGLEQTLLREYGVEAPVSRWLKEDEELHEETLRDRVLEVMQKAYDEKEAEYGPEIMRHLEKAVMLQTVDSVWKEHLAAMDHLRQGVGLRGYAQKNPKEEYKREAFTMFTDMLERIKQEVTTMLMRVQLRTEEDVDAMEAEMAEQGDMEFQHPDAEAEAEQGGWLYGDASQGDAPADSAAEAPAQPFVRDGKKVGRNEPCPCGSGKKYKHCHGKLG